MKSESGSHTTKPIDPTKTKGSGPLNQRGWRTVGGVSIAICGLMTFFGTSFMNPMGAGGNLGVVLYWLIWAGSLGIAVYMVILDLRFIRLQYKLESREIFHDTVADEKFRRALIEAQREMEAEKQAGQPGESRPPGSEG